MAVQKVLFPLCRWGKLGDRGMAVLLLLQTSFRIKSTFPQLLGMLPDQGPVSPLWRLHQLKKSGLLKVMLPARIMLSIPSDWSDMVKGPGFLHWFPGAAITNYHKLSGLKQQKGISSKLWVPRPKSSCWQAGSFRRL